MGLNFAYDKYFSILYFNISTLGLLYEGRWNRNLVDWLIGVTRFLEQTTSDVVTEMQIVMQIFEHVLLKK